MTKLMTLCLVREPGRVLLGMKKRGFGAGRWNGFGGKVGAGEEIVAATKRELLEEVGLTTTAVKKVGVLDFKFAKEPGEIFQVHIFETNNVSGEPTESDEMKPQWFDLADIPFDQMWPDDRHWFPLFLSGKKFTGRFLFSDGDVILEQELKVVDRIN